MKRNFFILLICLLFKKFAFSLDIKLLKLLTSIEGNPIGSTGVIDLYYANDNNLICVFERRSNRKSVFSINDKNEITVIRYEDIEYKYESGFKFIDTGKEFNLYNGSKILLSNISTSFMEKTIFISLLENPYRYYFYVLDSNDNVIFDLNAWRLDYKEFYPKTYMTSTSREAEYTQTEQLKVLELNPAHTNLYHTFTVNKKQNRIAGIFDNYNGVRNALLIFEIIYDGVCNDDKVRLRSEPNLNCETIRLLNKGEKVKIKDQTDKEYKIDKEKWYWYQVELSDGKIGWVYGKYLDIEK